MATSSEFKTSNQYVKYKITVTEGAPSVENNNSPVTVSVKFYRTNTGYTTYGSGTVYCKIDGITYSAAVGSSQKITNSGIVLFEKTVTVNHDSDGGKSLAVSAWISLNTPLTSTEQGFSVELTTIARASQPSCITWPNHTQNVGNFGDEIAIHMNRASSEFRHVVRYEFGTRSGTIGQGVENGIRWVIPLDFMNLLPSSTSGSGTIYVDTYAWDGSGYGKYVGTKWCGFTATVGADVKPSVDATGRLTVITDGGVDYGKPVQGLSKIKVEPVITTAYSSPIKTCKITVDGTTYTDTAVTTGVLRNSGTSTVTVVVTDQRNRSDSWSYDMDVLQYSPPRISELKVHRVDANGAEDIQGTRVSVTFSGVVSSMSSLNTAKYELRYKKTSDTDYTTVELDALDGMYSVSKHVAIFSADTTHSYDVEVVASDNHSDGRRSTSVSTAFSLMDWHHSGTGIAFGKVSEDEHLMDVDLDAKFRSEVYYKGKTLLDFFYPVNSIYISYSHTSPADLFGGTWVRMQDGFLWATRATDTIGQTGGEKTHTLTVNELPAHSHGAYYTGAAASKTYPWMGGSGTNLGYGAIETGGGAAHNNMPPYIQVSIWRRTA